MQKEKLLNLLKKKDQSVEKVEISNPYSQKELNDHVSNMGFPVEQTPKLSEIAKSLNPQIKNLDTKPELEGKDEKNPLSIVRKHIMTQNNHMEKSDNIKPFKSQETHESSDSNKQLSIQALKKLIAKYKGEK